MGGNSDLGGVKWARSNVLTGEKLIVRGFEAGELNEEERIGRGDGADFEG